MPLAHKFGTLPTTHCVPDIFDHGLKVVFCGTALGYQSAAQKAYYANPGNFFWRTLHQVGLTPVRLSPQEYPRVLEFGIGLTDLCKTSYGNDAELPQGAFDIHALRNKIQVYAPDYLAFTSKTGAAAFLQRPTHRIPLGLQPETVGRTGIFVLPSPSGQARIFWREEPWQALAAKIARPLR